VRRLNDPDSHDAHEEILHRLLQIRLIGKRLPLPALRTAATISLLVASGYLLIAHRSAVSHAFGEIGKANLGWVSAAVAAEIASVLAYGLIVRKLLSFGGVACRFWHWPERQ